MCMFLVFANLIFLSLDFPIFIKVIVVIVSVGQIGMFCLDYSFYKKGYRV